MQSPRHEPATTVGLGGTGRRSGKPGFHRAEQDEGATAHQRDLGGDQATQPPSRSNP